MNIVSQYPWWMYFLCFLLGALYAFALYRKDKKLADFSSVLQRFLAFLRFLTVSLLAILLLAPLLKYITKRVEQPIVIIAQDNSASIIQNKDSSFFKNEFNQTLEKLTAKLQADFQVEHFYFDEELKPKADSLPNYKGPETNFQELFEGLEARFVNRNVGAVLLISDGIYNRGANPAFQSFNQPFPVYSLALGDTTFKKDALIKRLLHNEIAYLGNEFPLEVDLLFNQLKGEKGQLSIYKGNRKVDQKQFSIEESEELQSFRFNIKAAEIGLQRYEVVLGRIDDEENTANNRREFYIDVLDGRQKILLLYDGPHPDIAAINAAISSQKNYQLKTVQVNQFAGDLNEYNLVIFYQLPTSKNKLMELKSDLEDAEIAQLFWLGSQSDYASLAQWDLPIQMDVNAQDVNDVYPIINDAFPLFKLEDKEIKTLQSLPPLMVPFGKYTLSNQAYHLFSQKVGAVQTNYPMLAFQEKNGLKKGMFIGEGLWHWRLSDYAMNQRHDGVDDLIQKIIQYMAVKADKSSFRINHEKKFFENEVIPFEVQLYNDSYEAVTEPEVEILIWDEENNEYTYTFGRKSASYYLQINSLPIGNYSYRASTQLGNKKYEEKGQFSVERLQLESMDTRANHNVLFQMAKKSGGELFYLSKMDEFDEKLKNREDIQSISYADEAGEDIINVKWVFYVFLFLLTLEWFLRKRNGSY